MATCTSCGQSILFGGAKRDGLRFCNQNCADAYTPPRFLNSISPATVDRETLALKQGSCPHCTGPGPVDVYFSHRAWSVLIMTFWKSPTIICCHRCGVKHHLKGIAISGLFGWWGFPFGLILTPVQIIRNIYGILSPPDPINPSPELRQSVHALLEFQALVQAKGAEMLNTPQSEATGNGPRRWPPQ